MEYRDLYDENRIKTNEKIKEYENIPKGRYYVTVAVFIENSNHEFLLQINKKFNMWSTTGGHPKSGESSIEGIVTEIQEELGIIIDSNELKLLKTYKSEDDFVDMYYLNKDIELSDLILQKEEVGNINWFSQFEIERLIKENKFLPPHIEYYRDLIKLLKNSVDQ